MRLLFVVGLVLIASAGVMAWRFSDQQAAGNDTATVAPNLKLTSLKSPVVSVDDANKPLSTSDIQIDQLLTLTNQYRRSKGIATLTLSDKLHASAQDKCNDMVARNYWSHNAPDGTEPWTFIQRYISNYKSAGENLAMGYSSAGAVVANWQNSPTHDKNLLDTRYSQVGFAVCKSEKYVTNRPELIVVQHFAGF